MCASEEKVESSNLFDYYAPQAMSNEYEGSIFSLYFMLTNFNGKVKVKEDVVTTSNHSQAVEEISRKVFDTSFGIAKCQGRVVPKSHDSCSGDCIGEKILQPELP